MSTVGQWSPRGNLQELVGWFRFNGTFSTKRLYRAWDNSKLMIQVNFFNEQDFTGAFPSPALVKLIHEFYTINTANLSLQTAHAHDFAAVDESNTATAFLYASVE